MLFHLSICFWRIMNSKESVLFENFSILKNHGFWKVSYLDIPATKSQKSCGRSLKNRLKLNIQNWKIHEFHDKLRNEIAKNMNENLIIKFSNNERFCQKSLTIWNMIKKKMIYKNTINHEKKIDVNIASCFK